MIYTFAVNVIRIIKNQQQPTQKIMFLKEV